MESGYAIVATRRGETLGMDTHYIREFPALKTNLINHLYFDPTSNTQMHVDDTSITNMAITYPWLGLQ